MGANPLSSQITSHLNKVPIKIQLLSLLNGFGTDRQPKHWCLFLFLEESWVSDSSLVSPSLPRASKSQTHSRSDLN